MTSKTTLSLTAPLKFLNSTVISFSVSLGFGASSETTLTVDLVDDCTTNDGFLPYVSGLNYGVGMPVYFPDNSEQMPGFNFGGVLSSWTRQKNSSGLTYNAIIKDPKQLLENTLIIIDSLITGPIYHVNYYNAYAYWEQEVLYSNNCTNYGLSGSNEKGMTYYQIINTLSSMNIDIYPSTYGTYPYAYKVDFSTFPGIAAGTRSLPQWYRVAGPGISILQLLEDICNVLAYEFYVYLVKVGNIHYIRIGLIDLNQLPGSFSNILDSFAEYTDISYGQEFRNEKSKMVLVGDSVHYLVPTVVFDHFFGEDTYIDESTGFTLIKPVVPYGYDDCGFWINKKIDALNTSLANPFPSNGPYQLSELDIRSAMSSYEMWIARVLDANTPGSFNEAIRNKYAAGVSNMQSVIATFSGLGEGLDTTFSIAHNLSDGTSNPTSPNEFRNKPEIVEELKKMHNFVNNLGSTYYGKQYITRIQNQKVCKKYDSDTNTTIYSDVPTNNGGWIDNNISVLGLSEPELTHFRTEDNRIKGFAQFTLSYQPEVINNLVAANSGNIESSDFSTEPPFIAPAF